jgi:hypothetical protein
LVAWIFLSGVCFSQEAKQLPGSAPLLPNAGDLQEQRKQIFDYFQNQIAAAPVVRDESSKPNFSSHDSLSSGRHYRLRQFQRLAKQDHLGQGKHQLSASSG